MGTLAQAGAEEVLTAASRAALCTTAIALWCEYPVDRQNQWTTRKAAEAAILGTFDTALEAAAACARAVGGGGLWGEQRRRFRNL